MSERGVSDGRVSGQPERLAVAFARLLRGAGLASPPDATIVFAQALSAVGVDRREGVYWAGRATLVRRPEDVDLYDQVFEAFWLDRVPIGPAGMAGAAPVRVAFDGDGAGHGPTRPDAAGMERSTEHVPYSAREVLRNKDFAACSPAELAQLHRLMAGIRLASPERRTRRRQPSGRRGSYPDLRRTARGAMRSGGMPLRRHWLEPVRRPRRVVLLCDVSGSMERYARELVRFLHLAVVGRGRVEAFTLGTRLTRVTRDLSLHDPDAALRRVAQAVPDWSGGTRLGQGLAELNEHWGGRGLARGAVVVVLSDGWDRGEPEQLAEQMHRLSRVAHKVVWVNPLKATPGFAPLARGLAAALPYVDELMEGHSLASLERLAKVVAQ